MSAAGAACYPQPTAWWRLRAVTTDLGAMARGTQAIGRRGPSPENPHPAAAIFGRERRNPFNE
jgi:hypothetical protein